MDTTTKTLSVQRGEHRIHAEVTDGPGAPLVLMHGFPDSLNLYDRLMPYLIGRQRVVRFDFLGWGKSDKPAGYPYTGTNQVGDIDAVVNSLPDKRVILVAHDASGPPAIDWALRNPERVEELVLLNTYYEGTVGLRRPHAIVLYSTPVLNWIVRKLSLMRPDLEQRLFYYQVGSFIRDGDVRDELVPLLFEQFKQSRPAFWRHTSGMLGQLTARRLKARKLQHFHRPVRIIFGVSDPFLNPRLAKRFAGQFPNNSLHLIENSGHYVQVDEPERVADLMTTEFRHATVGS
ncbi:alpha/beta fold hydrolase [Nocardia rhizosphaerihabitans]|nr:alpha/beta hydrolase [Nocardia rhizosphaerihabitans]